MSNTNDPFAWAPWLGQAQKLWEQTQNGMSGHTHPWAGVWPSAGGSSALGAVPNLLTAMQDVMAGLSKTAKTPETMATDVIEQINAVLQPLFAQSLLAQQPMTVFWQRLLENFPGLNGDGVPGMPNFDLGGDIAPLGAAREYMRQGQAYAVESAQLPQKLMAYQQALSDFPERLKTHLEAGVAALESEGKTLDSARAVFDFWVDAAELAFADIAHRPEYGKAQGELSNLLMQLKIGRQQMLDHAVEFVGLPSRRELNTTHRRVTALRRENRELKRALATLQQDVEDLKASRRTSKSRVKAAPRSKTSSAQTTAEEASA